MKVTQLFCVIMSMLTIIGNAAADSLSKEAEFAGSFYPQERSVLKKMIDEYLRAEHGNFCEGTLMGIIAPHAAFSFSGSIAGYSYSVLPQGSERTVILLGPSHRYAFEGISVYPSGFFSTPMGRSAIDEKISRTFEALSFCTFSREFFEGEHCLETQLPFLQRVMPHSKIVPILTGKMSYEQIQEMALHLRTLYQGEKVLVVVSTDLSHYFPYDTARAIDYVTIAHIKNADAQWLWDSLKRGERRACGVIPLITLLQYVNYTKGRVKILRYANSGDITGNHSKVVGYVSAFICEGVPRREKEGTMGLNEEQKKELLSIARTSLSEYLKTKKIPDFTVNDELLHESRAVFVTLKKNGRLRGCIGRIVPDMPLYKAVAQVVIDSAQNDSRFPPVDQSELDQLTIEISVMTPFEKVENIEDITVGVHGLLIRKGYHCGLLLPQVPGEYGWDRVTFLEQLCLKAGLAPQDYMKEDAVIYSFSAEVFSEKDVGR